MAVWWCIGGRVDVFGVGRHMQDRARLMNWGLGRDSGVQAGQCGGRLGKTTRGRGSALAMLVFS